MKMGLKPIALHLDNGWDTKEAVSNVRRLQIIILAKTQRKKKYFINWLDSAKRYLIIEI